MSHVQRELFKTHIFRIFLCKLLTLAVNSIKNEENVQESSNASLLAEPLPAVGTKAIAVVYNLFFSPSLLLDDLVLSEKIQGIAKVNSKFSSSLLTSQSVTQKRN